MAARARLLEETLRALRVEGPEYALTPSADADAINLSHGQLPYAPPSSLFTAPINAQAMRYQDPQGLSELRATYLDSVGADADRGDTCMITTGAKQALWLAFHLAVRAGGRALIPNPGWAPYRIWARALGAEALFYNPLEPAGAIAELKRGADVIVLNLPNNPTGAEWNTRAVDEIVAAAGGAAIVSDEVYRPFAAHPVSLATHAQRDGARVFVADSVSKWAAAPGLRAGFLVASAADIADALALRSTIDSCPPGPTQRMALALLSPNAQSWRSQLVQDTRVSVQRLVEHLERGGVEVAGAGAIYVWARSNAGPNRVRVGSQTLVGASGALFGEPKLTRLCAVSDDPKLQALFMEAMHV